MIKTNELRKGDRVQLRNGWFGTVADNARGNIRMVTVEGDYTETGSVYSHDIFRAQPKGGAWDLVEHTLPQLKLREQVGAHLALAAALEQVHALEDARRRVLRQRVMDSRARRPTRKGRF